MNHRINNELNSEEMNKINKKHPSTDKKSFIAIFCFIVIILIVIVSAIKIDRYYYNKNIVSKIEQRLIKVEKIESRVINIQQVLTKLAVKHNDVVGYLKQKEELVNPTNSTNTVNKSWLFSWFK